MMRTALPESELIARIRDCYNSYPVTEPSLHFEIERLDDTATPNWKARLSRTLSNDDKRHYINALDRVRRDYDLFCMD